MNKQFLSSVVAAMTAMSSLAATPQLTFTYADEPCQGVGVSWQEYTMLSEYPESFVELFAGNRIIAVEIASPMSYSYDESTSEWHQNTNNYTSANLCFYTEKSLEATPFYKQKITLSDSAYTWTYNKLTTPVEIEADRPFFVGYTAIAPSVDDTCFAVDLDYNSDNYGCWLGWIDEYTEEEMWDSYTADYGNMCIRLIIEGDNLPRNCVNLEAILAPGGVTTGKPFSVSASIINKAANDIENVTLEYTVGGETRQVVGSLEGPLKYDQSEALVFDGVICNETSVDGAVFTYKIVAINGEAVVEYNDETEGQFTVRSLPEGVGYERAVVIEEGTGTWCGNCPIGIVAFREMEEKYGDDEHYIPVAMHGNDKMESPTYIEIANRYMPLETVGYPNAIVNRDESLGLVYPESGMVDFAYKYAREITAIAKIEAEAVYNGWEYIDVVTTTDFAIETEADYSIGLAITQNNVGPYRQTNYFADYSEGIEMGGFETLPEKVEMTYDDVAVSYYNIGNLDGKAPGTTYTKTFSMPLEGVIDIAHFRLIAMVINNKTGVIENAVKVASENCAAVENVAVDSQSTSIHAVEGGVQVVGASGEANVYNVAGVLVASVALNGQATIALPAGLYVVKVGEDTAKVVVK